MMTARDRCGKWRLCGSARTLSPPPTLGLSLVEGKPSSRPSKRWVVDGSAGVSASTTALSAVWQPPPQQGGTSHRLSDDRWRTACRKPRLTRQPCQPHDTRSFSSWLTCFQNTDARVALPGNQVGRFDVESHERRSSYKTCCLRANLQAVAVRNHVFSARGVQRRRPGRRAPAPLRIGAHGTGVHWPFLMGRR